VPDLDGMANLVETATQDTSGAVFAALAEETVLGDS
jgi:hypothetical protein